MNAPIFVSNPTIQLIVIGSVDIEWEESCTPQAFTLGKKIHTYDCGNHVTTKQDCS